MRKVFVLCILIGMVVQNSIAQKYSNASAIVAIHLEKKEPILTIRGVRNYNVYGMIVDSVLLVNVSEGFRNEFNEEYLLGCKFLMVCLDTSQYYLSKTDWESDVQYIVETDVGFGLGDLFCFGIVEKDYYIPDPYGIKISARGPLIENLVGAYLTPRGSSSRKDN